MKSIFCSKCGTPLILPVGSENAKFIKCYNCDNTFKNPNIVSNQKTLNNAEASKTPKGIAIAVIIIGVLWIIGSLSNGTTTSQNSTTTEQNSTTTDQKVKNNYYDNSVYQVEIYVKNHTNERDSYHSIEWSKVMQINDNEYRVRHKYGLKNDFGDYIVENKIFSLDAEGNVINVWDPN